MQENPHSRLYGGMMVKYAHNFQAQYGNKIRPLQIESQFVVADDQHADPGVRRKLRYDRLKEPY